MRSCRELAENEGATAVSRNSLAARHCVLDGAFSKVARMTCRASITVLQETTRAMQVPAVHGPRSLVANDPPNNRFSVAAVYYQSTARPFKS